MSDPSCHESHNHCGGLRLVANVFFKVGHFRPFSDISRSAETMSHPFRREMRNRCVGHLLVANVPARMGHFGTFWDICDLLSELTLRGGSAHLYLSRRAARLRSRARNMKSR